MAKKGTVDTEGAAREQARGNHEDRLYAPVKSRHLYGGQRTVSYGRTEALTIKNPRTSAAEWCPGAEAERMRVEEFLDRWLPTVRGTVRPSTFKRHEEVVRLHIRPSLGGLKLLALEPAYVTGFVEGCLERIGEDDAEGPDLRRAGWEEGDRDFVPDNPKVEVEVRTGRPPAGP